MGRERSDGDRSSRGRGYSRSPSRIRSGSRSRSLSRSRTPPSLYNKHSRHHPSKRRKSNDMDNGRNPHSHVNADHDRGIRRGRSRGRSRSRSRSRSPYSYHGRSPTHHHDDVRGRHRVSATQVRVSPSRSSKSGGYSRENGHVGSPKKSRRQDDYDSYQGGLSSPTYLPYSVREHEQPMASRDHDRMNGHDSDDKDLENLDPHEYRMVKRERMRKRMVACIWRVSPSPPHDDEDGSGRYRGSFDDGNLEDKGPMISPDDNADTLGKIDVDVEREELNHIGEKIAAGKDPSPPKAYSDIGRTDSSLDEDRPSKQKKKRASKSMHRHHTQKGHASKYESSTPSSEGEVSSSESDGRQKSRSHRNERREKLKRKKKPSSSGRKKKGRSRKRHCLLSSDEDNDDDSDNGRDNENSSLVRWEKASASPSSSFERGVKESSSNQSDGETDKDDDTAVEIDEEAMQFKVLLDAQKKSATALENEPIVGPAPAPKAEGHISYGGALRPGEGDAIAQYVQQGKRIPRRGEVGLSAEEIQKYESLGYVMSGSRHQRMNAIRIRKENQVYSAEDKRALAMFNYEEKAKREHQVMSDLQRLIQRHIGQDPGPTHDPFAAKQSDLPPAEA